MKKGRVTREDLVFFDYTVSKLGIGDGNWGQTEGSPFSSRENKIG